jgi:hypothetical protein
LQLGDPEGRKAAITFDRPIVYRGIEYTRAVAVAKEGGPGFTGIADGSTVSCAITGMSGDPELAADPLDVSKWRGGLAIVGDLSLAPADDHP